jgi:hypothetical protein
MRPYGSKRNDHDYHWTGREEIIVYGNKTNAKRARQQSREMIESAFSEIAENEDRDALDDLAEKYGDRYDDELWK